MASTMTKERDAYFDNAKIILIALVVVGHAIEPMTGYSISLKTLYTFLYYFHMPLMIFIAGYFSKNLTGDYAKKVIRNYLIPYFIFETAYSIFDYYVFDRDELTFTYMIPFWITWFLMSMATWKIILPYAIKIKFALPVFIVLAVLVGYASDISYYATLQRTIVFFPFFLGGYYFDKKHLEFLFRWPVRILAIITAVVTFYIIFKNSPTIKPEWLFHAVPYEVSGKTEWYAGIYRISSLSVTVLLSACFLSLVPRMRIPLITDMGKRTIFVYLLHGFILKYLFAHHFYAPINTAYEKIGVILLAVGITLILSLPFVQIATRFIVTPKAEKMFTN